MKAAGPPVASGVEKTDIQINQEEEAVKAIFCNASLVLQEIAQHNKLFIHDYL